MSPATTVRWPCDEHTQPRADCDIGRCLAALVGWCAKARRREQPESRFLAGMRRCNVVRRKLSVEIITVMPRS